MQDNNNVNTNHKGKIKTLFYKKLNKGSTLH